MNNEQQAQIIDDTRKHLSRIHARSVDAIYDEVRNTESLRAVYPKIGEIHPAEARERHIQHVIFSGIRNAGYFAQLETMYFEDGNNSRRIDIGVWLPDVERWFFLEVKPCSQYNGYKNVLGDARKLVADEEKSSGRAADSSLRGVRV